ncbi:hypothetical protein Tco_0887267 [Tanacetum coccineum]
MPGGRSTHSTAANNVNPPNELEGEVAQQLDAAMPNMIAQFVEDLSTTGLLSWLEIMESVLHISKCPAESQVEFAACMLQGRALTCWNILVQTTGRTTVVALTWEDSKKL